MFPPLSGPSLIVLITPLAACSTLLESHKKNSFLNAEFKLMIPVLQNINIGTKEICRLNQIQSFHALKIDRNNLKLK